MRRTAVLAIDTSKSMEGQSVRRRQDRCAGVHHHRSPTDVYVGIVTFAGERDHGRSIRRPTAPRPRQSLDGLTLTRQTRLYDGVIQAVDVAGTEGQRSLLVLSDGADTSAHARSMRRPRGSRRPRSSPTSSRSEQDGAARRRAAAAGHGRPGPGDLVGSGRAAGRVRRRGRRPRPPGAGHRHAAVGLLQDRGHDQGHAADVDRFGQRRGVLYCRAGRHAARLGPPLVDPAVLGALRRPGGPGAGPGAPRGPPGAPQAGATQRRRPGHSLLRDPGRRWELRRRRPTLRCRRHLRLGEGDGGQRAAPQQGPRRAHQLAAPGGGQRAQVLRVAARARRAVLPVRSGRPAAGRRQPAHRARVHRGRTVRPVDVPRVQARRGAARRSTSSCPTRCS